VDSARWHRVRDLFLSAVEKDPGERGPFLDHTCGPDAGLRSEVEALLQSHAEAGAFLEAPALAVRRRPPPPDL
jgi:hypothetical protein